MFFINVGYPDFPISLGRVISFELVAIGLGLVIHLTSERRERRLFLQSKRFALKAQHRQKLLLKAEELAIEAKAASEAKSRFLAVLSHEIRTPMNGIEGLVSLVRLKGSLDSANPRDNVLLDSLQTSSARLLNTLNDMLDFAQGGPQTQGALLLKNKVFSLSKMVADLGVVFSPLVERKSIAYNTQVEVDVQCWLHGDEEKIYRVLSNLVSNAIKFTPLNGTVTFAVTKHLTVAQGSGTTMASCHFVVSDTGIGIAQDHLAKVFAPFYQVDQGDGRHYQGNGLGLAICKQIVEAMGGKIWAESVPSQGAQFHVALAMPVVKTQESVA